MAAEKLGCSKTVRSLHPQKASRRRSSATPHEAAFEDGGEVTVFQQPVKHPVNVLLIGASSFIGSSLGSYLHDLGHSVRGTVSSGRYETFRPSWLGKCFQLNLQDALAIADGSIFSDVGAVVFLAHDFRPGMAEVTIEATARLSHSATEQGVRRQLFVSSYSARPDAVADYGIVKYRLEQLFLQQGHVIVRPGLVIGRGGMTLRFFEAVKKYPVIPLPDGGSGTVPIISVRQLCEVMHKLLLSATVTEREINAFYPEMATMRGLVEAMAVVAGKKARTLPVPIDSLLVVAAFALNLGIKLPFNVDSFRSLKISQQIVHHSNIHHLLDSFDNLTAAVKAGFPEGI